MAFGAGGGRRRQRFSAFMATFFPVSFFGFSNWKEKRRAGLWSPAAAAVVTEKEEAGARRSGPGLAGRRLRGKGRRGRVREPRRPAGHALPPRGSGEGWLSWCRGQVSPTQRPTLASGPRPRCSGNGDESPNSISKNPDGLYI
ncbi:uncharacterized protein LOC114219208 [Eumetopias jubatus]|uniref:uncharacterized protein LOC114219208 n=1 Tax=Eumetopias jubatus TaxID=34886 RepID=UPI00101645C8|nr:uncharacterized protein LOC114219208 [Eumetopias jubatus]